MQNPASSAAATNRKIWPGRMAVRPVGKHCKDGVVTLCVPLVPSGSMKYSGQLLSVRMQLGRVLQQRVWMQRAARSHADVRSALVLCGACGHRGQQRATGGTPFTFGKLTIYNCDD